ncbi:phosphatidyl synthase [Aspergillus affinis]|uniref:phosphatidyl synthase n=1 Tax=Aspergillus affinis TaxID=1070780 RepID=UPI0022FF1805|nr:putative phosphatase [Aspergillus affinis]KAI9043722.1 putative phosphatase [Aspergillus affinis]
MTAADGLGTRVDRLSSLDASRADLYGGPNVVLPPQHLMASSAHDTAMGMEMAKQHLEDEISSEDGSPRVASPTSRPAQTTTDDFALAFDIDGVLLKGGDPIPAAIDALKYINGDNPYGMTIPYIFVTNGGGKSEEERCLDLSRQLELEVSPGQFICGHTPMRDMAERYNTVLVVGGVGEKCRLVAEMYGFKDVITPGDIIKSRKDTTPFRSLTDDEFENSRARDLKNTKIDAIFVFADSRDWAGDQQIILDVLMSKEGHLGTRSEVFNEGPPLFFSHNDVVWATSHEHTRIGMGALRASLEALYKAVTGKELSTIAFGKPQLGTYQFATRLLRQWRKDTHGINNPPRTVYFVGDTPESDVQGTNEFDKISDIEWFSILVKTGVYRDGMIPRYPPKKTCENVLEAVKFAMQREISKDMNGTDLKESKYAGIRN